MTALLSFMLTTVKLNLDYSDVTEHPTLVKYSGEKSRGSERSTASPLDELIDSKTRGKRRYGLV